MVYERPKHIPFPNVWLRFKGNIKVDGKPLEYKVQDVTEELVEPCVEHLQRFLLPRNALTGHAGIADCEKGVKEIKEVWRTKLREWCSLVAIVDGEGEEAKRIAGLTVIYVKHKNDPTHQFKGHCIQRYSLTVDALYAKENLFNKYGVDSYIRSIGLSVAAHYHGDSISLNLLRARDLLSQALHVPLNVAVFSNPAAIHEALKDGYEIIHEVPADEVKETFTRLKNIQIVLTTKVVPAS